MYRTLKKNPISVIVGYVAAAGAAAMALSTPVAVAQDNTALDQEPLLEEVVVKGIRRSLQEAADMKRMSSQIMDAISAEDMGKLPDQNAAESLKRVTGVQIGNRNGQGSTIRIRGMSQVNIELNGSTYVGAGVRPGLSGASNRSISLEDIPSDLLSTIEVIKAPSADMNEGALTGTVNLKTRRPLDLDDHFIGGTFKNTYSDVAEEDTQNYSLFLGKNWDDKFGVMVSLTDKENLTRNDTVAYRNWSATPYFGANPDALGLTEFVTATDSSGQTGVAISPQQINLEQREVRQDGFAADITLQFKPLDELDIYLQGVRTSYDETVAASTLSLGLYDINTGEGIALNSFEDLQFGQFTPGTTAVDKEGNPMQVDGEVTLVSGGFEIPSAATGGDSHTAGGQAAARDITNTNISLGGSWTENVWSVSTNFSYGKSTFDSDWMNQSLKGSYGNINCAWRDPRPLDPFSGGPVDCAENLRFGYDMAAGDLGSVFVDPTLTGVNPSIADPNDGPNDIAGGGNYLTDPYSYAVAYTGLYADEFTSRNNAGQVDFNWNIEAGPITSLEFGYRGAERINERTASRGVASHWREECTLDAYQLSRSECEAAGALFTDVRIGAEDGNSLYVQPPERQGLAVITDGSFMSGVDGAGQFPSQWISGNAFTFASDPAGRLNEVWGMSAMSDKLQDYRIEEQTQALYLKANFSLADDMVYGNAGVRAVETDTTSYSYTVTDDAISQVLFDDLYAQSDYQQQKMNRSYTNYLPSFNLNWEFHESWLLRFAANRSMARPDLGALVPGYTVTDVNSLTGTVGNENLDPWLVDQADLSLEWYFDEDQAGFASMALFYKDFSSFITTESGIMSECRARGETRTCNFTRSVNGEGELSGVELGYSQPLPLGFGVQANYTYLDSETPEGLPIPGNSENTYNLIGYYENFGFGARIAYFWQDEALNTATGFGGRPEYTSDRGQLDASINYDVNDYLSLTLSGSNLLQEGERSYVQIEERLLLAQQFDRTIAFSVRGRF
ncbi:TonB-dependent receptor [Gilvimarinus japonicus]|uniref:TonB-dependent receptor n=1 Tax=Gilvimarinus japonicus TaxID=1796469 RepID=A0ABV7HVM9_9GAMM